MSTTAGASGAAAQDDRGPQDGDGFHGFRPVPCLPDDLEALGLQQRPGRGPERRMIVNDQHGRTHGPMVPQASRARIVASHN
jgi:hypothetical protein